MARGRIIDKAISNSRKVNSLTDRAALIFTWIQPHTDDYGRIEGMAEDVLYTVVPRRNYTEETVEEDLKAIWSAGLVRSYRVENKRYLEVIDFDKYQILRKDRKQTAKCPNPIEYDTQWHTIDIPMTTTDTSLTLPTVNVSRSRSRSKDIGGTATDASKEETPEQLENKRIAKHILEYFPKAAEAIQGISKESIAIEFGKVNGLLKTRIKQLRESKVQDLETAMEQLVVYFLCRKKWKKDAKDNWYMVPTEAPNLSNMLAPKTWNELMLLKSKDRDYRATVYDAAIKLRGIYAKPELEEQDKKTMVDLRSMLDLLANKFTAKTF